MQLHITPVILPRYEHRTITFTEYAYMIVDPEAARRWWVKSDIANRSRIVRNYPSRNADFTFAGTTITSIS